MKKIIIYLLLLIIVIFSPGKIYCKTPQEIAESSFESVVLVEIYNKFDERKALGSGFFVNQDIIATNMHVIEDAYKGTVKIINKENKSTIKKIIAVNEKHDLALLKVDGEHPRLKLGNSDEINIGQKVYVIGNPLGLEGTFSEGIISSIREVKGIELIQITAPVSPGSSGGPVLDNNGQVIGIAFAQIFIGQNLNFAIPVNYLIDLIESEPEYEDRSLPLNNNQSRETKSQEEKEKEDSSKSGTDNSFTDKENNPSQNKSYKSNQKKKPKEPPVLSKPPERAKELVYKKKIPYYPKDMVSKGVTGNVLLKVDVNKNGQLNNIEIINSSGKEIFDKVAVLTVENEWQFYSLESEYSIKIKISYFISDEGNPEVNVFILY